MAQIRHGLKEVYASSVNEHVRLKSEHFTDDSKTFTLLFYCFLSTLAYRLFFESYHFKNTS